MPTEQEELRLSVTLDDQASAQLAQLQAALNNIGSTSNAATQGFTQLGQALRHAGGHAGNLHGSLNSMAARGGFIGGFFFEIGRGVQKMAEDFAKATLDIKAYADATVSMEQAASRAATTAAQFQRNLASMRASGIGAQDAAKMIQGFADALADLQREQSKVRENLLGGLRGAEFEDMRRLIQRIQTSDRETALNEVKQFGQDIRAYWTSLGQAERGARAELEFYRVLGVPDLDKLREKLEQVTPEIIRMHAMRRDHAERFQTAVEKTDDAWERSVRSVQATAFRVLPIRESAEGIAEFSESIAHWFEDWEGSISDANEELQKIAEAEEGGFWYEVFSALGITSKRTRGQEQREEGEQPGGPIPLPRPRPPIQTWRLPTPGGAGVPQQFMGTGDVGPNGPGSALDVGALGIPSIGDLLKPDPNAIVLPDDPSNYAGTGWRGLPMSKRVVDIRAQGPDDLAALEENSQEMEGLADELTRLNEFLAPEMMELMKRIMEKGPDANFHNAPMGGAAGESNPMQLPPGAPQPGGGAASEAAQSARDEKRSRMSLAMSQAMTYLEKNESKHAADLKDYMQTGGRNLTGDSNAWCARFVNAIQTRAGLPSLESAVGAGRSWSALAYKDWGRAVGADEDIREGDVMVKERKGGGHVGVATGNYRVNDQGVKEYEMLSGNIGGAKKGGGEVNYTWETIGGRGAGTTAGAGHGGVVAVRRGEQADVPLPTARPADAPGADVAQRVTDSQFDTVAGIMTLPYNKESGEYLFGPQGVRPASENIEDRRLNDTSMSESSDADFKAGMRDWRRYKGPSELSRQLGLGDVPEPGEDLPAVTPRERRDILWQNRPRPEPGFAEFDPGAGPTGDGNILDGSAGSILDGAANRIDINQTGRLTVDVNAPAGTNVSAEGGGVFNQTETNRSVPMDSQPAPAD